MPRHSLAVRAGCLLGATLQLTLPGAAAWADARLDAAGSHAVAHVESHTSNSCARIHPPDCLLCHFLITPVVASRATTVPIPTADEPPAHHADPAALLHPQSRPHPQPRAPPALF
ncbi:MAG TPA: hypothetical protein VGV12_09280 [Gemmatimonadales bacterium]|nr:hypothetical protein [Gemmatimonadales bacterium]